MSSGHSITNLLPGVKQADKDARRALFEKCYKRVAGIGRDRLKGKPHRGFNTDDVAISAFGKFLDRAAAGKLQELRNRDDVWQIMTLFVVDKISERLRRERRQRRGGGVLELTIDDLKQEISGLEDPALDAEIADAKVKFLAELPDDQHREVFALLAQGYTRAEIAETLKVSLRTVDRRLENIRRIAQGIFFDVPDDRRPE